MNARQSTGGHDATPPASATAAADAAPRVAARVPADRDARARLDAFLASQGFAGAERFLPKDDDELNDRLSRGEFTTAAFSAPADLLDMLFAEHADLDRWADTRIVFVNHAASDGVMTRAQLDALHRTYSAWCRGQRRQRLIAGCVLTAVGLAAMGVFLFIR